MLLMSDTAVELARLWKAMSSGEWLNTASMLSLVKATYEDQNNSVKINTFKQNRKHRQQPKMAFFGEGRMGEGLITSFGRLHNYIPSPHEIIFDT